MERRTSAPEDRLVSLLTEGASAYVETLAAAESAVNQGRFALAKILRAGGYALRVNAVLAARRLSEAAGARDLLQRLDERLKAVRALAAGSEAGALGQRQMDSLGNIISRSIRSLQEHGDVLERDVAQTLWVCYACGHVAESQQPTLCPECGAPAADLEACGPFYVDTPEHLGRLQPSQIGPLLASIPDAIAKTTAGCSEVLLAAKPEEDLWSVKEILAHMGEVDALFQRRLRLLLQSDSVADITGGTIPPWRLQESSGFERETFPALLVAFKEQRASTMREVDRLSAGDWSRFGRRGNSISTVLDLGRWLANHDRGHLEEMKRVLDRLSTSQAAAPPSS